jgi:hypothetical protein
MIRAPRLPLAAALVAGSLATLAAVGDGHAEATRDRLVAALLGSTPLEADL